MQETLIGRGREAVGWVLEAGSFAENTAGGREFDPAYGPGAVVGTGLIKGREVVVLANDAQAVNDRFPVVYFGVIGLEEAYKMAEVVYAVMEADREKTPAEKTPFVLIVDTPGNAPGKVEEIVGMNKATGAYQLALAQARHVGHPIVAIVIGRAISGAFLCHGLQADRILAMAKEYGTKIHVMPITSISRITKLDVERLEELSADNPVFAAGVDFFYQLGGVEEIIPSIEVLPERVADQIRQVVKCKESGRLENIGPMGRAALGQQRGGRVWRQQVIDRMRAEFDGIREKYV